METSPTIAALAAALASAQGEITGALKDSANPFFKSKYADLASCWDACRAPLAKNGLAVVQTVARGAPVTIQWETKNAETGEIQSFSVDTVETVIITMLMHASGEWIKSPLPMIPRDATPQGVGSAITYGRRYGLTAMLGIAQVDDDGQQASHGKPAYAAAHKPQGNASSNVHPDLAFKAAVKMRELLEMDVEENIKALKVLDHHDVLAKDNDLYIAGSEQLSPKERSAWKTYVSLAKNAEKQDRAVANAGKRF